MTKLKIVAIFLLVGVYCRSQYQPYGRERVLLDSGWKFANGHSYNKDLDFGTGKGSFSYYAKTGYGDGAAAEKFDDRAWRTVDLPHDWVLELPFDRRGTHSHGFKAMGDQFPGNNIGWYRKSFFIAADEKNKRINIEFEAVGRDAKIWVNGFYIGEEHSGYSSYEYDISAYLNYGGNNVVAVRADAGMEEGWYYEGAGIYRHVWLNKTPLLHMANHGTFITTAVNGNTAAITASTTVVNNGPLPVAFTIKHQFFNSANEQAGTVTSASYTLAPGETKELSAYLAINNPLLWSPESPALYQDSAILLVGNKAVDVCPATFGIRTLRFSADSGFFLNGKHLFLKGTNFHQDFAGVGVAVPDALQDYRIQVLKNMGSNAIRCAHNPPAPAFLDACDRLGMLVLDENRLMGTSPEHYQQLTRMVLRDRNHPSVIAWSVGNEEWAIEGNDKGAKIVAEMQAYLQQHLDSSRRITAAVSGGRVAGISTAIDVMGYNYNEFGDIDNHHKNYPAQPIMITEERTAFATRGVYVTDSAAAHMVPTDWGEGHFGPNQAYFNVAQGLRFCSQRAFIAGIFYWTGFDYRGEPDPFSWPQVTSQFGIVDLCGFPKDQYYFLRAAWVDSPQVHIGTHWNWAGREGQAIFTKISSNCDEVELFLNGKTLGKKAIPHLTEVVWQVPYKAGVLLAKGYKNGKAVATDQLETTGQAAGIQAEKLVYKNTVNDSRFAIVNIAVKDSKGRTVPTAQNPLYFGITGPGKIIGVGNGDPSSHEREVFIETVGKANLENASMAFVTDEKAAVENPASIAWMPFEQTKVVNKPVTDTLIVVNTSFNLPVVEDNAAYIYFAKTIANNQSVYLNGQLIGKSNDGQPNTIKLDKQLLRPGSNVLLVAGKPLVRKNTWDAMNTDPGIVSIVQPATQWKRNAFNGLAQVIVQMGSQPGKVELTITGEGLKAAVLELSGE